MTEFDVFTGALREPDPAARSAFLDEACAGDPKRRRRVEVLLRAHELAGGFLEEPAPAPEATGDDTEGPSQADSLAATLAPEPTATILEAAGTRIGPYKLLQKIGEGGMGSVFMAEQERPVRRKVALEVIKAGHGHRPGHRPLRGRAPGPGDDGPPQHRPGPRRRRHRHRPALLRHGAGQGRDRSPSICDGATTSRPRSAWSCSSRSARRSSTRTRRGSSTATSSRPTCWSRSYDGKPGAQGDRLRGGQGDRPVADGADAVHRVRRGDRHARST